MGTRSWMGAAGVVASLLGVVFAADALVVTDRERLEALADNFEGVLAPERLQPVLRLVDLSVEPLELRAGALRERYEAGETALLADRVQETLQPLFGNDTTVIQQAVQMGQEQARVALRVRPGSAAPMNITMDFAKHGERWLLRSLRLN